MSVVTEMPVLVIFPHNRCNCRCVMCDIWRIRQSRELTTDDMRPHMESMRALGVRRVVFSGGEPQLNRHLGELAAMLRNEGIRITLLTAGLLLETHAPEVGALADDVIVSLDGPPEIHDSIRNVPSAYARLARGIAALRCVRPEIEISARCTVQKRNAGSMRATVAAAQALGLNSISFLAADLTSEAFNRAQPWDGMRQDAVALASDEVTVLEEEVEALIADGTLVGNFIRESPGKLRRLTAHFRAHLDGNLEVAPRCNAPWVSAVIEADGSVRPCFFHAPIGNIRSAPLLSVVNSPAAVEFRERLDIASNPVCRRCVCSLYLPVNEVLATS